MYYETRFYLNNEDTELHFRVNKNLLISFFIGTPLVLIIIAMLYFWQDIAPEPRAIEYNSVPLTLLNFGSGDGTGRSKGNLTDEGVAHKGAAPASQLNDAEVTTNIRKTTINAETDPTISSNVKSVTDISAMNNNQSSNIGNSSKNIGLADGSLDGSGLGSRGRGMGLGDGFGDIEWGGGGNRIVLSKKPPKFPTGTNTSGEIRIRFRVKPDGTVAKMVILKKSDPAFENAAIEALKQWRFNAIKDTIEMEGIIPFRFKLK